MTITDFNSYQCLMLSHLRHTSHVALMLKGAYQCLMYILYTPILSTEDSTHVTIDVNGYLLVFNMLSTEDSIYM